MSKGIYVGIPTEVPIYEETVTELEKLSYDNIGTYFNKTNSYSYTVSMYTNTIVHGGLRFSPTNTGINSSIGGATLTAVHDLKNVKVYCEYLTEKNYDKVTVAIAGTKVMDAVSGTDNTSLNLIWSGDLAAGEAIDCKYDKDSSTHASGEKVYWEITCDPLTEITQEIVGYETKELARKVKKLYADVPTQVPMYGEANVPVDVLSHTNYSDLYFSTERYRADNNIVVDTSTQNGNEGLRFGIRMSATGSGTTDGMILTALHDLKNVNLYCEFYTIASDSIHVTVSGESVLSGSAGTQSLELIWSGDLAAGERIQCSFFKNTSTHLSGEKVYWEITCDPYTVIDKVIVGYEEKPIAHKIKKAYISVEGIARQCFYDGAFGSYTGDYTVSQVELDGSTYDLYELTSTGILTLSGSAKYWLCGGGQAGERGYANVTSTYAQGGRGGSGGHVYGTGTDGSSYSLDAGEWLITIGAGGTGSSFAVGGDTTIAFSSGIVGSTATGGGNSKSYSTSAGGSYIAYGGSGGGAYGYIRDGARVGYGGRDGQDRSTIPFGITALLQHSAGGGGGIASYNKTGTWNYVKGGSGGSNGSDGGSNGTLSTSSTRAYGGTYGGGNGGTASYDPTSATFYGGGGGGARGYCNIVASSADGASNYGSGYQGVCYLLIPA